VSAHIDARKPAGFAPGRELEDWLAAEAEHPDDDATGAPP